MFDSGNFPREPIAKHVTSIQLRSPRKNPDEYFKYVDISGVDNKIGKIIEFKTILGKDAPSRARKEIKKEDVLVSTVRPNLNATALVPTELDNQICSTGFAVLRSKSSLNPIYLYAFTRQREFVEALIAKMKGASYPAVTDKDVLSVEIKVPPIEFQNKFAFITNKVELMRDRQSASLGEIAELFNSLMFKAFKGELVQ
jgi:type I restriction enzyme S subunit